MQQPLIYLRHVLVLFMGLQLQHSLLKLVFIKKVLVVGAETLSKFVNWHDRNTCIIFADGAGAAVFGEVETRLWYVIF